MNRTPLRGAQNVDTEPVTMEELKGVIHKFKTNKAPGPNGTPIEFFSVARRRGPRTTSYPHH